MGIERSCAVGRKPIVGINYPVPWQAYGIYLGGGNPPGSNPAIDIWTVNLKANLITLRDELNCGVVRIFLLGNAANYGSSAPNPSGDPSDLHVFTPPPSLHPKFREHLKAMFQAFKDAHMLVIPSLIDFKAFGRFFLLDKEGEPIVDEGSQLNTPPISNGCTDKYGIVLDATNQTTFVNQVLEPFLQDSAPFREQIYAWEVQNEPTWNTRRFFNPERIAGGRTMSSDDLGAFHQRCLDVIEKKHGFPSTIGHRFSSDLDDFPTGTKPQFHYYPLEQKIPKIDVDVVVSDRHLPHYNDVRAFLGEIATGPNHFNWPDLEGADATSDTRVRVFERLKFVRDQGYPLVLLWPDAKPAGVPQPDPVQLTSGTRQAIIDFMKLP